jgi:predicted nucleotidyltransferase
LESEKKDDSIFDIIIYGSLAKGAASPRDIDILVIFLEGNLRERLEKIQRIKSKLGTFRVSIDIKQILLKDLFSSDFFARTGILLEGVSVFKDALFSETLGFMPYSIFSYALQGFTHTQKVKFNYILSGRLANKGILKEFGGERINSGVIKIPIKNSNEFEEILKENKVDYKRKDILEPI